jgi:hypothetical protein
MNESRDQSHEIDQYCCPYREDRVIEGKPRHQPEQHTGEAGEIKSRKGTVAVAQAGHDDRAGGHGAEQCENGRAQLAR